ncbi:MAG: tannase/feruloyl esterase family alpha/beta hydrolase [Caulobacteraceae bacterium]
MSRLTSLFAATALGATGLIVAAPAANAQPRLPQEPTQETVADPACAALATPGLFKDMAVTSAQAVKLGVGSDCEIKATLSPVPGSKIGVVYRLPKQWNGRLVGYGGGGWAGNVAFQTVAADLARGYATMQTDGGHPSPAAFDASWTAPNGVPDEVAVTDFSYRAVHQMTVTGKEVAAKYYGKPQDKALFIGCSTGGRMALMEAQRFPDDYDGIVAGAPVYSFRVQLAEIYRDWVFSQPGAAFKPADLTLVNDAVLKDCDALDGVKDGIVSDPAACKFDPAVLKCKPGQAAGACLTDAQVIALQRVYAEHKGSDGVVATYPYSRGSEPFWPTFQNTIADPKAAAEARDLGLRAIMFGDPAFSFASFDVERDSPKARGGKYAKIYEADDPNLKPFLGKGGKLILWHGLYDQGPSPWGTVAYNARMKAATGALAAADTRMFLAPGVLHCAGGPGPSQIDWLGDLDGWIKTGKAPEQVTARTPPAPPARPGAPAPAPVKMMVRPVCAYPAKARWDGKGDPNVEASFSCK